MSHPLLRWLVCFLMVLLCACGNEVPLQTGLLDADANEVLTLLRRHGISVTKTRAKDGVTLLVKEEQLARAGELMHAAGLPKRTMATLGQVFKKEGMISTPLEERARYLHGLSQELEYTLSQIDGVITARVHIVLPDRVAPGDPVLPSSASVFIKHHLPFDEDLVVPRVRRVVSNSIPGLSDEAGSRKLSVVLMPAQASVVPSMEWEQVGSLMLEASSAGSLRWWIGVAAAVLVLCLAGMGFLLWRLQLASRSQGGLLKALDPRPSKKTNEAATVAPVTA